MINMIFFTQRRKGAKKIKGNRLLPPGSFAPLRLCANFFRIKTPYLLKSFSFLYFLLLISHFSFSQTDIKCYPSNWWTGMKWNNVQIMLHGDAVGNATSFNINYPGVQLKKINKVENQNYVFMNIVITATAKPGNVKILPSGLNKSNPINFELKSRRTGSFARGVNSSDF